MNAGCALCRIHAVLAAFIVFLLFNGKSFARDVDTLITKIEKTETPDLASIISELPEKGKLVSALVHIIENRRDDWNLQIKAIRLLGEIGDPSSADMLIKVIDDVFFSNNCPALKWNAIVALGNFRHDSRVVEGLIHKMTEETSYLVEAAAESLGRIGDLRALPYLIAALDDKRFAVRMGVVKALASFQEPLALPFLLKVAEGDAEPLIREEAHKALEFMR